MTLAVMTRATRGHTGRAIEADRLTAAIYASVVVGAALRVAAPLFPASHEILLVAGGLLWSLGFALFVFGYWRMLTGPRKN